MTGIRDKRRWVARGAWALVDQGLFALANVVLNVWLARSVSPAAYGAFAVGYSLLLFIGAFHTALLTEPLLVFGPAKYARQLRKYLVVLFRGHWALSGLGSGLLLIAAVVMGLRGNRALAQAFVGLALAAPFSLLIWLSRRAAYLRFQPQLATIASAAYLVLLVLGLLTLSRWHAVSIFSALMTMSASGAIAGGWLWLRVNRMLPPEEKHFAARPVIGDHWRYGRWAVATSVLMWVPLNFFFVVLTVMVNLEASASLKALSNLVLPLLQANAALASLLLPAMVVRAQNHDQFKKLLRFSLMLFAAGAGAYSIVIGSLSRPLLHLLYGGKYDAQARLLWLLLLIPVMDGAMIVCSSALRSLERPDLVFRAQLAIAVFVLTAGVFATQLFGVRGAAAAIVLADLLGLIISGASVLTQLERKPLPHAEVCPTLS